MGNSLLIWTAFAGLCYQLTSLKGGRGLNSGLRRRLLILYTFTGTAALIGLTGGDDWLVAHGPAMAAWFHGLPPVVVTAVKKALWVFYLGYGAVGIYGLVKVNRRMKYAGLSYLVAQLVFSLVMVRIFKICIGRPRPGATDMTFWPFSLDPDHNSMPSGHTADAFTGFGVLDRLAASRLLRYGALALTLAVAASRIIRNEHYLSDLAFGAMIGYTGAVLTVAFLARWFGPKAGKSD